MSHKSAECEASPYCHRVNALTVQATTGANGAVASGGTPLDGLSGNTTLGDYSITLAAADNPTWSQGGKLDLSPILNLAFIFEYDFTPRT